MSSSPKSIDSDGPAAVAVEAEHGALSAAPHGEAPQPPRPLAPVVDSILDTIGNTPLLRVTQLDTGPCDLYLKLENQNPGGSIKDRIGGKGLGFGGVDRLMEAVELDIRETEAAKAESVWDGFCGLVRVCDETEFKEWGTVRALQREQDAVVTRDADPSPRPSVPGDTGQGTQAESSGRCATPEQAHTPPPEAAPGGCPAGVSGGPAAANDHAEAAPAKNSSAGSDEDGTDMPSWVVSYVLAPSTSSGGGSRGSDSGSASVASAISSPAPTDDALGSSDASTASDVVELPSPPNHAARVKGK